jgi:hypothetical protein
LYKCGFRRGERLSILSDDADFFNVTISLIGSEAHKARPDISDDSGFWLCLKTGAT